MKILFLTNLPSPYRIDFFNELGKLCDLTVLYEISSATDRDASWKGNCAKYFKEVYLNGIRTSADSGLCFSVLKYLKDDSYNIIVIGGYSTPTGMIAINYLKLKNKKFILSSDGGIIKDETKLKRKLKSYFISSAYAWLSTGENTNNYLMQYGANIDRIFRYSFTSISNSDILTQAISNIEKDKIRRELNIKERKTIVSVGQFINRKGFDVLIESMRYLPQDYGLYIIGGTPTEEYINLKEKYNLQNIYFEGFKNRRELELYYKSADIFVLPTREDIWGLVINEAMSYGLPIITTNKCIAGLELVENNRNGFIIPSDNSLELSNKIDLILSNDKIIKSMGLASLCKIKEYTIEKMAKEHIDIFTTIVHIQSGEK